MTLKKSDDIESLFRSAVFKLSVGNSQELPPPKPALAFLGRSNAGKSSLLNALISHKSLVKVSRTPGKTRLLNFFEIKDQFYLVDLPGFGYSTVSKEEHKKMILLLQDFLNHAKELRVVLILCDSQRDLPPEEIDYIRTAHEKSIQPILVRTKADKLNQSEKHKRSLEIQSLKEEIPKLEVHFVSSKTGKGVRELRDVVYKHLSENRMY